MSLATKANSKIAIKTFDYEGIDPEAKSKLIYLAADVNKATYDHIEAAIHLGQSLAQAQAILATAGCKGKFSSWLELECGFSRSTAYNYIAAFNRFNGESSKLGRFTLDGIYALSHESVPQVAVDEAVKLADKGTRINKERAQEILEKYRQLAPKKKPPAPSIQPPAAEPEEPEAEPEFDPIEIEARPKTKVDLDGLSAPYKQWFLELGAMIRGVEKLAAEERTGGHLGTKVARIVHDLTAARDAIREATPEKVCPKCDGEGCHPCAHTGFWTWTIVKSRK